MSQAPIPEDLQLIYQRGVAHGHLEANERIAALEQQVQTLREALTGCSHGSLKAGPCWCSHDHGMHDSWCIEARAALATTEPK